MDIKTIRNEFFYLFNIIVLLIIPDLFSLPLPEVSEDKSFSRCIYNSDSTFLVNSEGTIGAGNQHASSKIILKYNMSDLRLLRLYSKG